MIESAKKLPRLKRRKLSPIQLSKNNFSTGLKAEKTARQFLINTGYYIIASNLSYRLHEIDLVAIDPNHHELVFIEVKFRKTTKQGHPTMAVNPKKVRSMEYIANIFRSRTGMTGDYRFDIIAVSGERVEHFTNITWNNRHKS